MYTLFFTVLLVIVNNCLRELNLFQLKYNYMQNVFDIVEDYGDLVVHPIRISIDN